MTHLDESTDKTDSSMMSHNQMPGLAIQNFLKQEIGDPDDQNAPKSDANTDGKNTYPNLGSIKNKVYTSKWYSYSLVFQYGSPYWDNGDIELKYEDESPMP